MMSTHGTPTARKERCDVVIPLPPTWFEVTAVRSAWIVSSQAGLRKFGLFDDYARALVGHRDELLGSVAGQWLSMPQAMAHYRACDALGLSEGHVLRLAGVAAERVRTGIARHVVSSLSAAGVTPWSLVNHADRMWHRAFKGGAVSVHRLGPKDARLRYVGCRLFEIPYFRTAYRGVVDSVGSLVSRGHRTIEASPHDPTQLWLQTSWV